MLIPNKLVYFLQLDLLVSIATFSIFALHYLIIERVDGYIQFIIVSVCHQLI